jgi:hypothetical protein
MYAKPCALMRGISFAFETGLKTRKPLIYISAGETARDIHSPEGQPVSK